MWHCKKNSPSSIEDEDNAAEDGLPESVSVDMPMEENGGENNGANGEVNGGENGEENGSENGDVNVNSGNCDFDPDVSSDSFDSDLECQECEETFKTRKELDVSISLSSRKISSEISRYAVYSIGHSYLQAHMRDPDIHPQFF